MTRGKAAARLTVRVQPGARVAALVARMPDGTVKVKVTEPAREGRANEAIRDLLAARLDVPRGAIEVVRGAASRTKLLAIAGLDDEELARRLARALAGGES